MPQSVTAREFADDILQKNNIYILTHAHPDGDTIGTGIALCNALCTLGKRAAVLCGDSLSHHIEFMREFADGDTCFFGNTADVPFLPQYIVSVDVASGGLLSGSLCEYADKIDLALDHHEINTLSCRKLLVEPDSSSAGETLFCVLCEMEKITGQNLLSVHTASALYCAVSSDSGGFRFQNAGPRTFRTAARLIECGVKADKISALLFDNQPFTVFCAEALCTEHTRFYHDGKIALSYMTIADCRERKIPDTDFDTCVQLLRRIEGVEVSAFLKEKELSESGVSRFRISLRSNESVNVAAICANFGGGGHARAAGCTIIGTVESVSEQLCRCIEEQLK